MLASLEVSSVCCCIEVFFESHSLTSFFIHLHTCVSRSSLGFSVSTVSFCFLLPVQPSPLCLSCWFCYICSQLLTSLCCWSICAGRPPYLGSRREDQAAAAEPQSRTDCFLPTPPTRGDSYPPFRDTETPQWQMQSGAAGARDTGYVFPLVYFSYLSPLSNTHPRS